MAPKLRGSAERCKVETGEAPLFRFAVEAFGRWERRYVRGFCVTGDEGEYRIAWIRRSWRLDLWR
jgi:hypothetical protein